MVIPCPTMAISSSLLMITRFPESRTWKRAVFPVIDSVDGTVTTTSAASPSCRVMDISRDIKYVAMLFYFKIDVSSRVMKGQDNPPYAHHFAMGVLAHLLVS